MGLKKGAETIIEDCLKIKKEEELLILNDGNDQDLTDSLLEVLEEKVWNTSGLFMRSLRIMVKNYLKK